MKKTSSLEGWEKAQESFPNAKRLSSQEMENELDSCPSPWKCPVKCYGACVRCLRKMEVN